MKKFTLIFLLLALSACSGGGSGSFSQPASQPVTVTPTVPGVSWPPAGAVLTKTRGSISCSTFALGIKCTDGTSIYTPIGLNYFNFTQLEISNDMVCGLTEAAGTTNDCTALNDPACTEPATANRLFCMNAAFSTFELSEQGTDLGFTSPTYQTGTKSISVNGTGEMCLEQTAYFSNAAFDSNTSVCGTAINGNGYLE